MVLYITNRTHNFVVVGREVFIISERVRVQLGRNEVIVDKFLGLRQLVKLGHVPNEFAKSHLKRIRIRKSRVNAWFC